MNTDKPVIVIGGGWAGLAAAMELSANNVPVKLYESAPQLGGRARNTPFGELTVDNGQHLLIGAYHETLRLLRQTGVSESELFLRTPLHLKVYEGSESLQMRAPSLPAPLHLAWAQLTANGLGFSERINALLMSLSLMISGFKLSSDISVTELLHRHRQSETIIRRFWEPLCLATLNTPMHKASASIFLRVLQDSFTHHRHDADLLIPKQPLGDLFPQHLADYLKQRSIKIMTRSRVEALHIENGQLEALTIAGNDTPCRTAILATSPRAAVKLMQGHEPLEGLCSRISQFGAQPISTVYLQYPEDHQLEEPMIGLSGTVSQWIFDRRHCGQPGLLAIVISAEGNHESLSQQELVEMVTHELKVQFPHWPTPLGSRVIREKFATFECSVGLDSLRPQNSTTVSGLHLAGDYTDTGYPATLEGAVRSGVECAQQIIPSLISTTS